MYFIDDACIFFSRPDILDFCCMMPFTWVSASVGAYDLGTIMKLPVKWTHHENTPI